MGITKRRPGSANIGRMVTKPQLALTPLLSGCWRAELVWTTVEKKDAGTSRTVEATFDYGSNLAGDTIRKVFPHGVPDNAEARKDYEALRDGYVTDDVTAADLRWKSAEDFEEYLAGEKDHAGLVDPEQDLTELREVHALIVATEGGWMECNTGVRRRWWRASEEVRFRVHTWPAEVDTDYIA